MAVTRTQNSRSFHNTLLSNVRIAGNQDTKKCNKESLFEEKKSKEDKQQQSVHDPVNSMFISLLIIVIFLKFTFRDFNFGTSVFFEFKTVSRIEMTLIQRKNPLTSQFKPFFEN